MQTDLAKAIRQTFPQLDANFQDQITSKVTGHMLEFLKNKSFENDPEGLKRFEDEVNNNKDQQERSKKYGETILRKFLGLPQEEMKKITEEYDQELVSVVHRIYQAAQ